MFLHWNISSLGTRIKRYRALLLRTAPHASNQEYASRRSPLRRRYDTFPVAESGYDDDDDDFSIQAECPAELDRCVDDPECLRCLSDDDDDGECDGDILSCSDVVDSFCCQLGESCIDNAAVVEYLGRCGGGGGHDDVRSLNR